MMSMAFAPENVIAPIESDEHHARSFTLAGELMCHVASHHRNPSGSEPCRRMVGHLGKHGAADDDQLLLRRMVMPGHHTGRRRFQYEAGRAFDRVAGLERRLQTFYVAILRKLHGCERRYVTHGLLFCQRGRAAEERDTCDELPNVLRCHPGSL